MGTLLGVFVGERPLRSTGLKLITEAFEAILPDKSSYEK